MLSRSVADRVGAAKEAPGSHAYRWSSDKRPRTRPSGDLGVMKDCLRRHRNLVPTAGALPAFQFQQFISTLVAASRTHKPIRPPTRGQVFLTSLFARELRLKFAQGFRKRRTRHSLHYSLWFAETTG